MDKSSLPAEECHEIILLREEHLADLVARTQAITACQAEVERYSHLADLLQEGLTLYLAHVYGLALTEERWHLDLAGKRLVRLR